MRLATLPAGEGESAITPTDTVTMVHHPLRSLRAREPGTARRRPRCESHPSHPHLPVPVAAMVLAGHPWIYTRISITTHRSNKVTALLRPSPRSSTAIRLHRVCISWQKLQSLQPRPTPPMLHQQNTPAMLVTHTSIHEAPPRKHPNRIKDHIIRIMPTLTPCCLDPTFTTRDSQPRPRCRPPMRRLPPWPMKEMRLLVRCNNTHTTLHQICLCLRPRHLLFRLNLIKINTITSTNNEQITSITRKDSICLIITVATPPTLTRGRSKSRGKHLLVHPLWNKARIRPFLCLRPR